MVAARDAYLRLHPSRSPLAGSVPTVPGSLIYIDLDPPTEGSPPDGVAYLTKRIVGAPPGFFLQASDVLLRWPDASFDPSELAAQADALGDLIAERSAHPVRAGFAVFPVGSDPEIVWSSRGAAPFTDSALLARARTIELYTLLQAGGGIWQPRGYHYALPSGEHSSTFIRLADAFKRPRDVIAVATWLHREIRSGLAVVTDTPTLLPLVSALELISSRAGLASPAVVMLADYPSNHFEVEHAVADVSGADHVLGLVSVSSTGTTAQRIALALDRGGQSYALETLVTRGSPAADEIDALDVALRRPWFSVEDHGELYANSDECRLCRDAERSRVVFIDPRSFEPMVLPRPDLLTPAVRKARRSQDLWQFYDRTMGVGIHGQPHATTREFRSNRPRLAVRCYPQWLLDAARYEDLTGEKSGAELYGEFLSVVERRAAEIAVEIAGHEIAAAANPQFEPGRVDAVIVTAEDESSPGFSSFLEAVVRGFGLETRPEVVVVERPYSQMETYSAVLSGKSHLLVMTLGAITGTTMQQLLLGLHTILPQIKVADDPQIAGLVLHARPEDDREWVVLRNAYTRLHAIWKTPISLASPFEEEEALLGVFAPEDDDARAAAFYLARLAFLNESDPEWESRLQLASVDPWAVFWGMPLDDVGAWRGKDSPRLRPGSFYGHRLRACSTFAAVGSAMQLARLAVHPKSAPILQQFEMPAILRSYFDPPIVASVLRWMEPHEAWWGDRPADAANVLAEAFARAGPDDLKILMPECLLAAALGKVPESGYEWLAAVASHYVWCWQRGLPVDEGGSPWSDEEIGPVQLGLALVRRDHRGAGDHLQRATEGVRTALGMLESWNDGISSARSLATAQLLRAIDAFNSSAGVGNGGDTDV